MAQRQLLHEKYIEIEEEILGILKHQDKFITLDKSLKKSLCEQVVTVLKPEVVFALPGKD